MDAHDLWQENKRWILGVVLGLLVFWIGRQVIDGLFGARSVERKVAALQSGVKGQSYYDQAALAAADEEHTALAQAKAQLTEALVFTPSDEFRLEGKGPPDLHWDQVRTRVRRDLVARGEALGVELAAKGVEWPKPEGREEIEAMLVAGCLTEQALTRLLDAHEAVRAADPDALGVVGIDVVKVVAGRDAKRRAPTRRTGDEIDPDSLVREERVQFRFRADEPAVKRFLEACRAQKPPIALAPDFKMAPGKSPGDPLVVSGTLVAVRLVEGS